MFKLNLCIKRIINASYLFLCMDSYFFPVLWVLFVGIERVSIRMLYFVVSTVLLQWLILVEVYIDLINNRQLNQMVELFLLCVCKSYVGM